MVLSVLPSPGKTFLPRVRDLSLLIEHALATGTPRQTPVAEILGVTPLPRAIHRIPIPPRARITYAAMLGFCDCDGVLRISQRGLAKTTGQSAATIRRVITLLTRAGLVEVKGRHLRCRLRGV
jgi:hypothetical protein